MPPAKIPGYYFDESRGRYFKITNGAVTTSDGVSQKYHNNSVQAEKRNQHFDSVEKLEQSKHDKLRQKKRRGQHVIRNPHAKPFASSEKLEQRLRRIEQDNLAFVGFKTGTINLDNIYYKGDIVDRAKLGDIPARKQDVPPHGEIVAFHKEYFIVATENQWGDDVLGLVAFTNSGQMYATEQCTYCEKNGEYLRLTSGSIMNTVFGNKNYQISSTYAGYDSSDNRSDILQVCYFSGLRFCTVLKFQTFSLSNFGRFEDLTLPLMKFLKNQFSKLHTKGRALSKIFGLDAFELVGSSKSSIEEMNLLLKNSSANDTLVETRLNTFLSTHDKFKPKYFYRPTNNKVKYRIENCVVSEGRIVIITTDGQIVYFELNHESKRFENFKLFTTKVFMVACQLALSGDFIYVGTSKEILAINYKDKQLERHAIHGLRKFFILSPTQWLIITRNQICFYDSTMEKLDLIMSYNNKNDARQQFELVNNHLIFNVDTKFKAINLSRAVVEQSAILEIQTETSKSGIFKDFKLDRIIDMGIQNGFTVVGFQFVSQDSVYGKFESHYI
ncbi:hypothetical protein KGF57_004754 [Candida theae]|uniref:Uncharacterized protein n=1 Tax=Candida theae TaxID=1198502 RepID=A0AAD5BAW4_9ASCO|nr:uncharacterized protein KGF57_004754 [Candida theae]KAI5949156.1 hypothetical protein KGF57_004754 [Candida theae]